MWILLGSQFKQTLKSKTLKRQLEIWILTGRLTLNIHLFLCVTTVLSCFKKGLWSFSTHWNIYRWFMMLGIYFKIIWNGGIRLWKEQGIRVQYLFVGGHHSIFVYFKSILSKMFAEMGRGVHREPNWIDTEKTSINTCLTFWVVCVFLFLGKFFWM